MKLYGYVYKGEVFNTVLNRFKPEDLKDSSQAPVVLLFSLSWNVLNKRAVLRRDIVPITSENYGDYAEELI